MGCWNTDVLRGHGEKATSEMRRAVEQPRARHCSTGAHTETAKRCNRDLPPEKLALEAE